MLPLLYGLAYTPKNQIHCVKASDTSTSKFTNDLMNLSKETLSLTGNVLLVKHRFTFDFELLRIFSEK
jgi:hypothetical protein